MSVDNTDDDLWIDLNTPLLGPANAGYGKQYTILLSS